MRLVIKKCLTMMIMRRIYLLCLLTLQSSLLLAKPATIEEHWQTAKKYFEAKEYLEAAKSLEKLLSDHPSHWEARPMGAWFYWEASKKSTGSERSTLEKKAEHIILEGLKNPSEQESWLYHRELGDFYKLRKNDAIRAYPYYKKSTELFSKASSTQKASVYDRLARTAEELGRKGEAVEASCRALELDPKDKMALARIKKLSGDCKRKNINVSLPGEDEADPKKPKPDEGSSH